MFEEDFRSTLLFGTSLLHCMWQPTSYNNRGVGLIRVS